MSSSRLRSAELDTETADMDGRVTALPLLLTLGARRGTEPRYSAGSYFNALAVGSTYWGPRRGTSGAAPWKVAGGTYEGGTEDWPNDSPQR